MNEWLALYHYATQPIKNTKYMHNAVAIIGVRQERWLGWLIMRVARRIRVFIISIFMSPFFNSRSSCLLQNPDFSHFGMSLTGVPHFTIVTTYFYLVWTWQLLLKFNRNDITFIHKEDLKTPIKGPNLGSELDEQELQKGSTESKIYIYNTRFCNYASHL